MSAAVKYAEMRGYAQVRYKMGQMHAPRSKELSGWKEIASHLGVGVRTAQDYEKNLRLPVHRQPAGKGRVFPYPDEPDAWRKQTSGNGLPVRCEDAEVEAQPPAPVSKIRPRGFLIAGTLGVSVLAMGAYLWRVPHGPASDLRGRQESHCDQRQGTGVVAAHFWHPLRRRRIPPRGQAAAQLAWGPRRRRPAEIAVCHCAGPRPRRV